MHKDMREMEKHHLSIQGYETAAMSGGYVVITQYWLPYRDMNIQTETVVQL